MTPPDMPLKLSTQVYESLHSIARARARESHCRAYAIAVCHRLLEKKKMPKIITALYAALVDVYSYLAPVKVSLASGVYICYLAGGKCKCFSF